MSGIIMTFYTKPEVEKNLKKLAEKLDRPVSWVINSAIEKFIKDKEKK